MFIFGKLELFKLGEKSDLNCTRTDLTIINKGYVP